MTKNPSEFINLAAIKFGYHQIEFFIIILFDVIFYQNLLI